MKCILTIYIQPRLGGLGPFDWYTDLVEYWGKLQVPVPFSAPEVHTSSVED
jgi:hypothetical protein